jgi:hypothetical protein
MQFFVILGVTQYNRLQVAPVILTQTKEFNLIFGAGFCNGCRGDASRYVADGACTTMTTMLCGSSWVAAGAKV